MPKPGPSGATEICTLFREGKRPHGIGGKKLIDNQVCSESHRKACRMFVKNGTLKKWGCKKGENCSRYHAPYCSSSLANKTCYDPNCTRPLLVGTTTDTVPCANFHYTSEYHDQGCM